MALNLLSTAGLTVLLPRASALNSRAECADYVRKAVALGIAAAIFSAGGLALAGGIFVPIFGGPNYTASIPILRWLCVAHGIGMVLTPLMLVLYPLRREGYIVIVNALLLGANVVFGIWLTPSYGLKGAAWALIGARVLMALATGALVCRALREQRCTSIYFFGNVRRTGRNPFREFSCHRTDRNLLRRRAGTPEQPFQKPENAALFPPPNHRRPAPEKSHQPPASRFPRFKKTRFEIDLRGETVGAHLRQPLFRAAQRLGDRGPARMAQPHELLARRLVLRHVRDRTFRQLQNRIAFVRFFRRSAQPPIKSLRPFPGQFPVEIAPRKRVRRRAEMRAQSRAL